MWYDKVRGQWVDVLASLVKWRLSTVQREDDFSTRRHPHPYPVLHAPAFCFLITRTPVPGENYFLHIPVAGPPSTARSCPLRHKICPLSGWKVVMVKFDGNSKIIIFVPQIYPSRNSVYVTSVTRRRSMLIMPSWTYPPIPHLDRSGALLAQIWLPGLFDEPDSDHRFKFGALQDPETKLKPEISEG